MAERNQPFYIANLSCPATNILFNVHKLGYIPPFLASINRSPTQPRVFCTKSLVAYGFSHRTTVMFTPAFVGCWQYPVLVDEIPTCQQASRVSGFSPVHWGEHA